MNAQERTGVVDDVAWRRCLLESLAVFVIGFAGFTATMCPTIGFGDTAILIDTMVQGRLSAHVNNHPLTVLVGYLFTQLPFGSIAVRANFVSVFFGALTLSTLYLAFRRTGVSAGVSLLTVIAAAVSHSLWWHSTIVENYAASAFLVMLCYLCLLSVETDKKMTWLYAACFIAALSISNHIQNGFLCAAVAVAGVLFAYRRGQLLKTVAICAGAALLGLLPWIALVAKDARARNGWSTALESAFVGKFADTFFSVGLYEAVKETAYLVWLQSPTLLLPIAGLVGLASAYRRWRLSPAIVGMALHIVTTLCVFSGYSTWDRFAFMLPAFVGLWFFAGLGVSHIAASQRKMVGVGSSLWCVASICVAPFLYGGVVRWAQEPGSVWHRRYSNVHAAHLYNQAEYIANPNKRHYRDVEAFAELLFERLPDNSIFLDDDSRSYYPLADYFQRYEKKRSDISFLIVNSWGFSGWGATKDQVGEIVEKAYYLDKPFFLPVLGHPYAGFLEPLRAKIPLDFEKFDLGNDRWVYKLVTASQRQSRVSWRDLVARGYFKPLTIAGGSGELNIEPWNILFSTSSGLIRQEMQSFGPRWLQADQIFVTSSGIGSSIDLIVNSAAERTVNAVLYTTTAPDYGRVRVSVGSRLIGEVDLFSPRVARAEIPLGKLSLDEDGTMISLRVVGKSEASSGYLMAADSLRFQ